MSSVRQRIFVNGLLLTGVLSASPVAAQRTYFISESTDFTGNGCQNSDLNDVTSELTAVLKDLFF